MGIRYETGLGAPEDLDLAMEWYRKAADQGHAKAERAIGVMYEEGEGVTQDSDEAMRSYEMAAREGSAGGAQFREIPIAVAVEEKDEEPVVELNVFDLVRDSAERGAPEAQYALGLRYEEGRGIGADAREAVAWYRLAADQGYATAQTSLGVMYMIGAGVGQDDQEALRWFQRAADQGEAAGQFYLGLMILRGKSSPGK